MDNHSILKNDHCGLQRKSRIYSKIIQSPYIACMVLMIPSLQIHAKVQDLSGTGVTKAISSQDFEAYINSNLSELDLSHSGNFDSDNIANIELSNATNNIVVVSQKGSSSNGNNEANIKSSGDANTIAASQTGNDNSAYILVNGNNNTSVISQYGVNNNGIINQYGNNNDALILQKGTNNYDIIEQTGNNNKAILVNASYNLSTTGSQITQTGNSSPIVLIDGMSRYNITVSSK
ncbi:MAG: hypothetical protein ACK5NC_08455 [Vibrio sp.]